MAWLRRSSGGVAGMKGDSGAEGDKIERTHLMRHLKIDSMILRLTIPLIPLLLVSVCTAQTQPVQTWRSRLSTDPELSGQQRAKVLLRNNFLSTGALMGVIGPSIGGQFGNTPREWGRTPEGFGRRVGLQAAMQTSNGVIESGSAALFGRDPRYQKCGCKGLWKRSGHAFSGLVLGADAQGVRRFDPSNLIAAYGSGYVGASLYPSRYNIAVKGYQLGSQQAGQAVLQNLASEFGPDIARFLKRKILRR